MKKAFVCLVIIALMLSPFATAEQANLPNAATYLRADDFERYPSCQLDLGSGKWSVRANEADALIDRFWSTGNSYTGSLCVFALELEGNAKTGVWLPVLRFYYMAGKSPINATAVSLLVDGVRYDLAAQSAQIALGTRTAEQISAPLTAEGLQAIRSIPGSESVSLRLIGEEIYTAELNAQSKNTREQIEAASLAGISPALALLESAGVSAYALWDLSAAWWKAGYGFAPAFAQSAVTNVLNEAELSDAFGMVLPGDKTPAALTAQTILMDAGFMSGTPARSFDKSTSDATARAQHYFSLIQTGCMDTRLAALLAGEASAEQSEPVVYEMKTLGSLVQVNLSRYWLAEAVSPANAPSSVRAASNKDNVLLAADGWIRNLSGSELRMFMQMGAKLVYNDSVTYETVILCERDAGEHLDTSLIPLAESRLIVYAEIPASLAQDTQAQWRIELSADQQTVAFTLE